MVTLKNAATDASTTVWIVPGQPIDNMTIAQLEDLARKEAAKQHIL
jgi:hypothetical protein